MRGRQGSGERCHRHIRACPVTTRARRRAAPEPRGTQPGRRGPACRRGARPRRQLPAPACLSSFIPEPPGNAARLAGPRAGAVKGSANPDRGYPAQSCSPPAPQGGQEVPRGGEGPAAGYRRFPAWRRGAAPSSWAAGRPGKLYEWSWSVRFPDPGGPRRAGLAPKKPASGLSWERRLLPLLPLWLAPSWPLPFPRFLAIRRRTLSDGSRFICVLPVFFPLFCFCPLHFFTWICQP